VRGVASPEGRVAALPAELERARDVRLHVYQSSGRIGSVFEQRRANVTEVLAGGDLGLEISGGVPGIITANLSDSRTLSQTIQVTPLIQALLLEETERERGTLIDLSVARAKPGSLLYFVGHGQLFRSHEKVEGVEDAEAIQAVREDQELTKLSTGASDPSTVVWIAHGSVPLASIASTEWLDDFGNFRSYWNRPPFGILALFETTVDATALLAPLLIWHDTAEAAKQASADD
jgi:hypothetical protein